MRSSLQHRTRHLLNH